jgi:hypothetical protein
MIPDTSWIERISQRLYASNLRSSERCGQTVGPSPFPIKGTKGPLPSTLRKALSASYCCIRKPVPGSQNGFFSPENTESRMASRVIYKPTMMVQNFFPSLQSSYPNRTCFTPQPLEKSFIAHCGTLTAPFPSCLNSSTHACACPRGQNADGRYLSFPSMHCRLWCRPST